ncbi:MAG: histidine kinase [Bacteroidales bacterium]|nr:histidine kinase [Bacteroidales bacterium]
MKKILFLFLMSLLVFSAVFGQVAKSSAYNKRMKSAYNNPKLSVLGLLDSSDIYIINDRDKCFGFLEQAYLLSLKREGMMFQYMVYRKLGAYYEYYKQHDLAAKNYENSIDRKQFKYSKDVGDNNYFDFVLKAGEQYRLASKPQNSLDIYKKHKAPKDRIVDFSEAKGDAYFDLKDYSKALKEYKYAESLTREHKDYEQNTLLKLKIAKIYSATNNDKELQVLNQANTTSMANSNKKLQIETESELADYYLQKQLPEQEIIARNSIITNIDNNEKELKGQNVDIENIKLNEKVKIAKTYNSQSKSEDAIAILEDDDFALTIDKQTIESGNLELKKEAAKTLSEAYLKMGNEQKALQTYEQYVALLNKLYKQKEEEFSSISNLNKQVSESQWRIEFLEKNKEIYDAELLVLAKEQKLQDENIKFQRWSIATLIAFVGLLIILLVVGLKRYRLQQKHNLFLDLKSLRTQMNPHFIFNALNSVNGFIARNDELNANKYLVRFSKLMRSILDNSESDFIPLSDEVKLLELYLQLEHSRFANKFSYNFELDKTIDVSSYQIPPMLIQPYIENAIWHGLRYKDSGGLLSVSITNENDILAIRVQDNGIGRKKSKELKSENQKKMKSRGIKNTQKRLEILEKIYKKEIQLSISDVENSGEGTRVEILIPRLEE